MTLILLLFLVLLTFDLAPLYPYSRDWGYFPSGTLLIILIVLLVFYFR